MGPGVEVELHPSTLMFSSPESICCVPYKGSLDFLGPASASLLDEDPNKSKTTWKLAEKDVEDPYITPTGWPNLQFRPNLQIRALPIGEKKIDSIVLRKDLYA